MRAKLRILALLTLLALATGAAAQERQPLRDVRLSLVANNSTVYSVIEQIAAQTDRTLLVGAGLDRRVTLNVQDVSFPVAMRLLSRSSGMVLGDGGDRLAATVPYDDVEALRGEPQGGLSAEIAAVYAVLYAESTELFGARRERLREGIATALRARAIDLSRAGDVRGVATLRATWSAPALFPGLIDGTLFVAYLGAADFPAAERLIAEGRLPGEMVAVELDRRLPTWERGGKLPEVIDLFLRAPATRDAPAVELAWKLFGAAVDADRLDLAARLRTERRLEGDGWVDDFRRRLPQWSRSGGLKRVTAAIDQLDDGRAPTAKEAAFIADVGAMLIRVDLDGATTLLKQHLTDAPVTPATYQFGAKLIAARLRAGDRDQARDLWRTWYRPTEVADHLRQLAASGGRPQEAFPAYHELIDTARALGEAGEADYLGGEYVRLRAESPRMLRLLPVIDTRFLIRPGWRELLDERLALLSEQYEQQFGIRMEVLPFHSWEPRDEGGPTGTIRQLQQSIPRGTADLVVGFITHIYADTPEGRRQAEGRQILGMGAPEFRGYMVMRDLILQGPDRLTFFAPEVVNETFIHELGHVFGAMHVDDPGSVMRQGFGDNTPAYSFDALNAAIVRRCKWLDFQEGFTSLEDWELEALASEYAQLGPRYTGEEGNGANLREGQVRLVLGDRERGRGNARAAEEHYRRVLALDVNDTLNRQARVGLFELNRSQ